MTNFQAWVCSQLDVSEQATATKKLIKELIHDNDDYVKLKKLIGLKGMNKIFFCLCEMKRSKNINT